MKRLCLVSAITHPKGIDRRLPAPSSSDDLQFSPPALFIMEATQLCSILTDTPKDEDGEKLMIFGIGRLIDPSTAYLGCERWLCVCIQYFSLLFAFAIESWIEAIS